MIAPEPGAVLQDLVEALELDQVEKREKAKAKAKGDKGGHDVCSNCLFASLLSGKPDCFKPSIACVAYSHQYAVPQFPVSG
ncbi:hypothetical protein AB6B38_13555 [Glycocaulis abyssi]|uniref:Uncharacterized protein n=1 Tax=Glycocaulis abyssi TaxID=1433403 RepID=A0ABV9NE10_9PROT